MTRGLLMGSLLLEAVEVGGASRDSQAGRFSLQLLSGPGGPPGVFLLGCLGLQGGVFENCTTLGGFQMDSRF